MVSTLIAWSFDEIVAMLYTLRLSLCTKSVEPSNNSSGINHQINVQTVWGFFGWIVSALALGLSGAYLVTQIAPRAGGSGIPELKSMISSQYTFGSKSVFSMRRNYLSLKVFCVKISSLMLSKIGGIRYGMAFCFYI